MGRTCCKGFQNLAPQLWIIVRKFQLTRKVAFSTTENWSAWTSHSKRLFLRRSVLVLYPRTSVSRIVKTLKLIPEIHTAPKNYISDLEMCTSYILRRSNIFSVSVTLRLSAGDGASSRLQTSFIVLSGGSTTHILCIRKLRDSFQSYYFPLYGVIWKVAPVLVSRWKQLCTEKIFNNY